MPILCSYFVQISDDKIILHLPIFLICLSFTACTESSTYGLLADNDRASSAHAYRVFHGGNPGQERRQRQESKQERLGLSQNKLNKSVSLLPVHTVC